MILRTVQIAVILAIAGFAGSAAAAPKATGNVLLTCENNFRQTFVVSYMLSNNEVQLAVTSPGKVPMTIRSSMPNVTVDEDDEFAQSYFFVDSAKRVVVQYIPDREDYEMVGTLTDYANDMANHATAAIYLKASGASKWSKNSCKTFGHNGQFKVPSKIRKPLSSRNEFVRRFGAEWAP